jgi:hypothetical protein
MPQNDALDCELMLDFRWCLIQVAAISGGAEHPELLPNDTDWDEMMQNTAGCGGIYD